MSRNDQAIRHWYLLRRLESTHGLTLQELGDPLPEDYRCHPRTLRRDLEALEVSFPIYTDRAGGHSMMFPRRPPRGGVD